VAAAGAPVSGVDVIFNALAPGDQIPLGDDDFEELFLPFTFSICGEDYNSVFVNSNGSLTFGAGSTDFSESVVEMLGGPPRIAGLWDDLAPNNGGTIVFDQTGNEFWVTYTDVPEFINTGANSFEIKLHRSSNKIDVTYGTLTATDGVAGVSCGGRVTSGLEPENDLSASIGSAVNPRSDTAAYEWFSAADNDLSGALLVYNAPKEFKDLTEPNGTFVKAVRVNLPYNGADKFTEIAPTGADIDFFRLRLDAGFTFSAEIVTGQLDSLLGLFDAAGNLVAADDDSGAGLLSRLAYPVATTGTYYLGVTTFPDFGFTGAGGSGGRYVLTMNVTEGFFLTLGDDDFEEVALPFSFPFQGSSYTSVFVNSNGSLTFGSGDTDFSETVAEFLNDQPRIAALWDDLSPNNGGTVVVDQTSTTWTVTFDGVPEFFATGANTFSVTLYDTGRVDITYGTTNGNDGLVGVTPGGGVADPGGTDLSAAGTLSVNGTTYELFGSGAFDLDGTTVTFQP